MTNHPTTPPTEASVPAQQISAAGLLIALLRAAPTTVDAYWKIPTRCELDGHIFNLPDDQTREAMKEWAAHLGSDVKEQRGSDDTFTTIETAAVVGGVEVRVWSHIEQTVAAEEVSAR